MAEMRKVRLEFLGPAHSKSLKVTDLETGKVIPVISADFHADMKSIPILTITTYHTQVEIETEARVIHLCPGCKKEREEELKAIGLL